jgi:hypothetical protein
VLDIVVSHQGLPAKVRLMKTVMSALVARNPEKYRASLRRMAALRTRGVAEAARKAQQLLEQSLQAELRNVVLRGLQGSTMELEEVLTKFPHNLASAGNISQLCFT